VARAEILDAIADAFERRLDGFVVRLAREAGKTRLAAIAEVREAVDFCRYYAAQARAQFGKPMSLPSPTGETNSLSLHGRGVFACISPWNFPLAIFTGQVAAALAAGNTVAAKPPSRRRSWPRSPSRRCSRRACPPTCSRCFPVRARSSARR
jgi:RHH-type proline utilization regulon transcriptional repressor/proline dehydrogenase/delta 1-pyrroline-5-carboxylate dehydrogenase